jgi:hypothetical protein
MARRRPTSPHWYRPEDMRDLIAAYLTAQNGGPPKLTRDFIEEFAGLARTQVRKAVLAEAGMSGALRELVVDGALPMERITSLLDAMKRNSRPIKPEKLGLLGEDHVRTVMLARHVSPDSIVYAKALGTGDDDLPFVIEFAYGIYEKDHREKGRHISIGLNCSPVFNVPTSEIGEALARCRFDSDDPVELFIHRTMPRFAFTGHGKGSFE